MVRLRVAAITMMAVVTLGQPARADGAYFGVGFGAARLRGDLDRYFDTDGEVGGRIIAGLRFDDTALEVSFFGTDLHDADGGDNHGSYSTLSLGVGVKQYVPLDDHFSLYGRAGVDRTWLGKMSTTAQLPSGFSGRGLDLGAGLQIDWRWHWRHDPASLASVAVWLDAGVQRVRLEHADREPIDGTLGAVNIGFSFQLGW